MSRDPYSWIPVVQLSIDESLKNARSARACCDAYPGLGLTEAKKALEDAINGLENAESKTRMAAKAVKEETNA